MNAFTRGNLASVERVLELLENAVKLEDMTAGAAE